jgi:predicted AAA+ superfamily ATPase
MYGALFENWCIAEIRKNHFNQGLRDGIFYFRDSSGNEIDLIIERETGPMAVEIKSSNREDLHPTGGIKYWQKYQPGKQGMLIHQGKSAPALNANFDLISWKEIDGV